MDLGIFDRFGPSLKPRALIQERKFDMNRSNKYNDRYVIPMHRKNVWTNKWMQDPSVGHYNCLINSNNQVKHKLSTQGSLLFQR
jgi:hypothetical protein